jgi:hypothetical protein
MARAGPVSVSRLIQRIWVASRPPPGGVQAEQRRPHHPQEHGQDLAGVGGQQVAQELADVGEDRPSLADGGHDGGEVVVGQDHLGRFFGDVGAGDAHGDADVGRLERGGVVHAVAGHGHDVAVGLEGVDDAELVLGRDRGS